MMSGIHELLHGMGFWDEYGYSTPCEADIYCDPRRSYPNVATFEDKSPYSSDYSARFQHSRKIPWFSQILDNTLDNTLITNGSQLGTPVRGLVGLYPSDTCEKTIKNIKSWRPGSEDIVMGEFTTFIPEEYWDQIAAALNSTLEPPRNQEYVYKYEYGPDHKIKNKKILLGKLIIRASKNKSSAATSNQGAQ